MNELRTVVAILIPFAATWLLLRAVQRESGIPAAIERVGAALALSIGLTSIAFFLWRVIGGPVGGYQPAETALCVLVAVALASRRVSTSSRRVRIEVPPEPTALRAVAALGLSLLIGTFLVLEGQRFAAEPHGEWDAWAMWNMRAAFVAAPTEHWADGFTLALYAPADYPLLLPASIARLWTLGGQWSTTAPVTLAGIVGLATILLAAGSLLRVTGALGAALGLALLVVPGYAWSVTSQCADAVLAMFILMAVTMLIAPENPGRLAAAGAAAGFAAWTKNEGLVAALVIPIAFLIVSARSEARATVLRRSALVAAGLVPVLAVVGFFKLTLAPPSELLTGIAGSGPMDKLLDVTRHQVVASHMLGRFAAWGGWNVASPVWCALGWLALGAWNCRRVPVAAMVGAGTLVSMSITYYVVYILTAHDLMWHLNTSWTRLIAQLWPTLAWTATASALVPLIRSERERAAMH